MNYPHIITELKRNGPLFPGLLTGLSSKEYTWKPAPEKWCLLEIICHLVDEEREDFRARLKHVLEVPDLPLPPIDPQGWVLQRQYLLQNFEQKIQQFEKERIQSVAWLESLSSPKWNNAYIHPKFGPLSAELFLANWLEHDYLHFRQILGMKHFYLKNQSAQNLDYAGKW